MSRRLFLIILLITVFVAAESAPRIVGGTNATILQYPFMGNIHYSVGQVHWQFTCGGILVNNSTVLSAAFCFSTDGRHPQNWRVNLGTELASGDGVYPAARFSVANIIMHPLYSDKTLANDIAIVKLRVEANYGDITLPARLPAADFTLADDEVVVAVGWGNTIYNGNASEQLQHVETQIVNWELCRERYATLSNLTTYSLFPAVISSMICTGNMNGGYKDACHQGDRGGPIVYDGNMVVGIVSWAFGCANPWYPGINTKVADYVDWIADTAA